MPELAQAKLQIVEAEAGFDRGRQGGSFCRLSHGIERRLYD